MTPSLSGWLAPPSTSFSGTFFATSHPDFSSKTFEMDMVIARGARLRPPAWSHSPIGFKRHRDRRANVQLDARSNRPLEECQHSHFTLDLRGSMAKHPTDPEIEVPSAVDSESYPDSAAVAPAAETPPANRVTRRSFLSRLGAAGLAATAPPVFAATPAPAPPVADA